MGFWVPGVWGMSRRDWLSVVVIVVCVFAILADWLFEDFIPQIHGRFFPVTSPITITDMEVGGHVSYETRIEGWAEKFQDCSFNEVRWNLGERGGRYAEVGAEFLDRPQLRGVGRLEWDALYVDLSPSQVVSLSFADVVHDCGFWWPVVTRFYDGRGARDRATFEELERIIVEVGNEQIIAAGYPEYVND